MILVGCQDAGPAEYISCLLSGLHEDYICFASNISGKVFRRKGIKHVVLPITLKVDEYAAYISQLVDGNSVRAVLTGTCWDYGLDDCFRVYAKKLDITVVSIIEHWSWYRERFEKDGRVFLPDHIIVNDAYSKSACKSVWPDNVSIHDLGNPALEERLTFFKRSIDNGSMLDGDKAICFISEKYRQDFPEGSKNWQGFDEYKCLEDIIEANKLSLIVDVKLHPSENSEKYQQFGDRVRIVQNCELVDLLKSYKYIVGMGSMLLLEASLIRSDIVSYRPNEQTSFFGNEIGVTHKVTSKNMLSSILSGRTKVNNKEFGKVFLGSRERVLQFIRSVS